MSSSNASTSPQPGRQLIRLHPSDNVATALAPLAPGMALPLTAADGGDSPHLVVQDTIPFGHKVALAAIGQGEAVRKYGEVIGLATAPIRPGAHVHVHNVESQRGRGDLHR